MYIKVPIFEMIELIIYVNALFIMILGMILLYILYDMHKISMTIQLIETKQQNTNKKLLMLENKYEAKMIMNRLCTNLLKHNYVENDIK